MRTVVVTIALLLQLLLSPSLADSAQASGPTTAPVSAPVSAKAESNFRNVTKGYSCRKNGTDSHNNQLYKCANVTWTKNNITMNGPISVQMRNRTSRDQAFTCKWEETKTWSFSASVSSEIEAGVIFARAKVSISASVSYSKAVTTGTMANITAAPKSVTWCKSGMAYPEYGGKVRDLKCAWTGYCAFTSGKDYRAKVPKQFVWEVVERKL